MEKKEYEFCLRCGRKLKSPLTRERGYGAICYEKVKKINGKRLFSDLSNDLKAFELCTQLQQ